MSAGSRPGNKSPAEGPMLTSVKLDRAVTTTDVGLNRHAWNVLAITGATFMVIGLVDLALAWIPLRFGDPEWEFGTISATLNNLPVPAMGLGLFLASAMAVDRTWQIVVGIVFAILSAAALAVVAAFYGLAAPLAWRAGSAAVGQTIIGGAMVKAVVAMVAYFALAVVGAILGLRALRTT